MLSAGALQTLLQHLHHLLLPIITPSLPPPSTPSSTTAESSGAAASSSDATDNKGKLAVAAEDLDILLAVLEALAPADAAAGSRVSTQVGTRHLLRNMLIRQGLLTQHGVLITGSMLHVRQPTVNA